MRLMVETFLLVTLVWFLHTIRAKRIAMTISESIKRKAARSSSRAAQAWLKNATRDTRQARSHVRFVHNAPSYTTYNSNKSK